MIVGDEIVNAVTEHLTIALTVMEADRDGLLSTRAVRVYGVEPTYA